MISISTTPGRHLDTHSQIFIILSGSRSPRADCCQNDNCHCHVVSAPPSARPHKYKSKFGNIIYLTVPWMGLVGPPGEIVKNINLRLTYHTLNKMEARENSALHPFYILPADKMTRSLVKRVSTGRRAMFSGYLMAVTRPGVTTLCVPIPGPNPWSPSPIWSSKDRKCVPSVWFTQIQKRCATKYHHNTFLLRH